MPLSMIAPSMQWWSLCVPVALALVVVSSAFAVVISVLFVAWFRVFVVSTRKRREQQTSTRTTHGGTRPGVYAFFHPHCSAGGGGERVLWKMVQVLGKLMAKGMPIEQVIIYTVDSPTPSYQHDLIQHVQNQFSLTFSTELKASLSFVHLHQSAFLLEPAGSFSLLMESIGAMRLAYTALSNPNSPIPHLFIDTTGCAFTYLPAVLLFGCRVLAYVHYPTISTDMLRLVWERRRSAYNHQAYIAASAITTYVKLIYYLGFAIVYGAVGSLSTLVLVNSTWTHNHIQRLWKVAAWRGRIRIVYPPCSLAHESQPVTLKQVPRQPFIVSIGQFRPEKDHVLQIESMAKLVKLHTDATNDTDVKKAKLVLIGSCRGPSDEARLKQLRQLCTELQLTSSQVEFVVNRPFSDILPWLDKASVGIHTMWNEHFGIGIVEMMAAGLIVIAHNSGGPKSDIVVPLSVANSVGATTRTGYLAITSTEYAEAMCRVLTLDRTEAMTVRCNAQESAKRFTDDVFAESFEKAIIGLKPLG